MELMKRMLMLMRLMLLELELLAMRRHVLLSIKDSIIKCQHRHNNNLISSQCFIIRDSKQILLDHLKAAGLDPSILDESNAGDNQDLEKDEVLHRPHLENFYT